MEDWEVQGAVGLDKDGDRHKAPAYIQAGWLKSAVHCIVVKPVLHHSWFNQASCGSQI